ncbi:MAG: polysaccharide biosynthesis/export family protein [Pyrinomonadaceae bacterium]
MSTGCVTAATARPLQTNQQQQQQTVAPANRQRTTTATTTVESEVQAPAAAVEPQKDQSASQPAAPSSSSSQTSVRDRTQVEDTVASRARQQQTSEDQAAVLPYYNNFLATYRLGPEDVVSVSVFGLERYSKGGITIPPNGRISYPLIPEGVMVVGKTTEELQDELRKKLEEYIIDPKITVTLDQAKSARYSVLGDVRVPGVKPMLRRLTVFEALADAGGVLETGSKKKVIVLRRQLDGAMAEIPVNVSAIEKGRAADLVYLVPGDQIVVPGNVFKTVRKIASFASILSFARIFRIF